MILVQYYLITGAHVADDIVYQVVKTVYENKAALAKAFGVFNRLVPDKMPAAHSVPYHPGAIRWYQEKGLWPPQDD